VELLRAMRLFVSVVQSGSLSSAGRQLGLSPASVSRHMNSLEESLGVRLLNRTSRKLTLTEAGEIYYRQAEQILHQITEANESVAQLQSVPRGTLRVHSRMLVGHQYIVPALPGFIAQYPEIKIDLMLSNFPIDLVERNIDVDVRIGKMLDSSLVARKLASSERLVCAAPAYLERHPEIVRPADLAAHNCLTYRLNMGRNIWRFVGPDNTLTEVPVMGNFQSDNGQALLVATQAGVGVALMPDWSIRDDLASGRLRRIFPDYRVTHVEFENGIYAVYQKSRHMSAKVRLFIDFLAALFKAKLG
jgi:DNA-binding transcriptional LysR family regulator